MSVRDELIAAGVIRPGPGELLPPRLPVRIGLRLDTAARVAIATGRGIHCRDVPAYLETMTSEWRTGRRRAPHDVNAFRARTEELGGH